MLKNKFIKSTFILIISGFITKILGFIIKIIYTRLVGTEGISLYTLIVPTYSLFITIITLSLPLAISKLVAEKKYSNQKIISNAIIIIILINLFMIGVVLLSSDYIANSLLKESRTKCLFIAMSLTFPFISISSILKGYFFGKQNMYPNAISNIIEQLIRIFLIILIIPLLIKKSSTFAVMGLILFSIITEFASILVFMFFLPKNIIVKKNNIKYDKIVCKNLLGISVPAVSSRFIGNIGFFFEPIILTNLLLKTGFSHEYILTEYGVYNAYSIALLTMPSFFIMAISSALVPEISRFWSLNNKEVVRRRFKQALLISFIIGIIFSTGILLFRNQLLNILYGTSKGSEYIKILAPVFVLFYLEGPLISTLQAINLAKKSFKVTLFGVVLKLSIISGLALFKFGIYSLIYAEIINIFFVVILNSMYIKKKLF